jgi:hypothetical protein
VRLELLVEGDAARARLPYPPSEELLRELAAEARRLGVSRVVVETVHEAGEAWIRAGFTETLRVLEGQVSVLELHEAQPGPSHGCVHLQTDDLDAVVAAVRQTIPRLPGGSAGSVVVPPRNGWVAVHDELCDREPEMLRRLATELSDRFGAVVLLLGVEEGAVVRFVLLERGRVMDEYLSAPEYHGPLPPGEVVAMAANPTVVARLTGADPARVRAVARTAARPADLDPAPELLVQIADVVGVPGAARRYSDALDAPGAILLPRA